jgi:DNA-binding NarL/FixJ family response regulator
MINGGSARTSNPLIKRNHDAGTRSGRGKGGGFEPGGDRAALSAVTAGEVVLGSAVAPQLLSFFASADPVGRSAVPFPQLTDREREILDQVAAGLTNRAIAARLCISEKTVRNYLSSVLAKLPADDRSAAIVKARKSGLGGAAR